MTLNWKAAIRPFLPPIFGSTYRYLRDLPNKGRLFGGDDALFLGALETATSYAEYGCGQSTIWIAQNTDLPITSVDTSNEWLSKVRSSIQGRDQAHLLHIDLGPLGAWGRPQTYAHRDTFLKYIEGVWTTDAKPDLVLIDGRFRVACFLASVLHAAPGTRIIFDDYVNRPEYKVVEDYLAPEKISERQALFVVPSDINDAEIRQEMHRFSYVMN